MRIPSRCGTRPSRGRRSLPTAAAVALLVGLVQPAGATAGPTTGPASTGALVGTPADGLPPGVGILLLDVPVERADDPRANTYVVDHAIPGAVVRRQVRVTNGSDVELPLSLYGVPAIAGDGWLVQENVEPGPGELAAWITVDPPALTLRARSYADVEVTITIPPGAAAREHYAVVVAEPPVADAGGGVGMISRVGLRVYLSVGVGDEPVTDFEIDTLTAARRADGVPTVDVGVTNTGGRALDVSGELLLTSEDGLITAGPFPTAIPSTVGTGRRGAVTVLLDPELPPGPWVVRATMRSGLVERVAEASLTFPAEAGDVGDPVEAIRLEAQKRILIPVALVLLLAALLGLWFLLLARRRDDDEEEEPVDDPDGPAGPEGLPEVDAGRR